MQLRKFLLGTAAGISAGYLAFRAWEGLATLGHTPSKPNDDPAAYGRLRRALAATGAARSVLGTLGVAYGPFAPLLVRATGPLPAWLRPAVAAAVATAGASVLELGASFIDDYDVERRFGLTEQSPRAWLADTTKSTALATTLSAGLALFAAATIRRFPHAWPYVAGVGLLPLLIAANIIVPVYILPMFNNFEPLSGPLEERLRELARRFGVGDAEILRMDMSRQTKKANAFVAGIGHTHRIVLGDTLVTNFPPEEVEFVVAHELGHYVTRDTWRMIAIAEASGLLMLVAVARLSQREDDDDESGTLATMRAYALLSAGLLLLRPAVLVFSRSREWAADRFALDATHDKDSGVAAFRRLRDQNLAEEEVPAWFEFLFSSHPSLGKRIAAMNNGSFLRHVRDTLDPGD